MNSAMPRLCKETVAVASVIPDVYAKGMLETSAPPDPSRGLTGIGRAHEVLMERDQVGMLIGGIPKAMFLASASLERLHAHKDVDVMVLAGHKDPENKPGSFEQFEGGIDWWEHYDGSYFNGNGVRLRYAAYLKGNRITPGLYVPNLTVLNTINEIETDELFMDRHPSAVWPFVSMQRLVMANLQIQPTTHE